MLYDSTDTPSRQIPSGHAVPRRGVPGGAMQADRIDPVQVRYTLLPEDWDKGVYPRSVIRPMYARFLLNRMGGATLNVTAEAVKTPWPGPQGKGMKTWLDGKPARVNQYHKLGLSTQQSPGPVDLAAMQSYQSTYTSVRARLSQIIQSLNGG